MRDECRGARDGRGLQRQVFPYFNDLPCNRAAEHLGNMLS